MKLPVETIAVASAAASEIEGYQKLAADSRCFQQQLPGKQLAAVAEGNMAAEAEDTISVAYVIFQNNTFEPIKLQIDNNKFDILELDHIIGKIIQ